MKKSLLTLAFLLSPKVHAATPGASVVCNPDNPKNEFAVKVKAGKAVQVLASERITGHTWTSNDGLKSKVLKKAPVGGMAMLQFVIDTKKQSEKSQTYSFTFKRPWESDIVSTCKVTVVMSED